ncbi:ATP-grasp domain-containing protein [[Eubacterium] cellulosolvens]
MLAIGAVDVSSLTASANRAGYSVFAVDFYGDQDLEKNTKENLSVLSNSNQENIKGLHNLSSIELTRLAKILVKNHDIDVSLLSSGLDDSFDDLSAINDLVPILGNTPEAFLRVRNRNSFFSILQDLEIPHPKTEIAKDLKDAKDICKNIGFPFLIKPLDGYGGLGIKKISTLYELDDWLNSNEASISKCYIQEYLVGTSVSVSVMAVPGESIALTVNEQLIGMNDVGQREPFGYCGNIVPFTASRDILKKCEHIAEKVVNHFSLKGSNGVDLVISDGIPHVIEVNPRFQGTLECTEKALGINLVETHVKACTENILPDNRELKQSSSKHMRLILFAKKRAVVPDLILRKECRDIPHPRTRIETGEPVCSIILEGNDRKNVLMTGKKVATKIYESLSILD